jgi:hypothetical protein
MRNGRGNGIVSKMFFTKPIKLYYFLLPNSIFIAF